MSSASRKLIISGKRNSITKSVMMCWLVEINDVFYYLNDKTFNIPLEVSGLENDKTKSS